MSIDTLLRERDADGRPIPVGMVGAALGPIVSNGWALVATADPEGDGNPDYLLCKASTRQTAIWYLNNNVYTGSAFGPTLPAGWSLVAP
jgi:hypothetical protein